MIRLCAVVLLAAGMIPLRAEMTLTDIQVAARALTFLEDPMSGRVRVGIVYSPAIPRSRNEAERLAAEIGSGMRIGRIEFAPVLVPFANVANVDVDLLLLTEFAPADSSLATIADARKIPCVTTDLEKVMSGVCAVGVQSRPRVEITVNREAAERSGMRFATAFRVMVTEI